jgi:hypothetical protein
MGRRGVVAQGLHSHAWCQWEGGGSVDKRTCNSVRPKPPGNKQVQRGEAGVGTCAHSARGVAVSGRMAGRGKGGGGIWAQGNPRPVPGTQHNKLPAATDAGGSARSTAGSDAGSAGGMGPTPARHLSKVVSARTPWRIRCSTSVRFSRRRSSFFSITGPEAVMMSP